MIHALSPAARGVLESLARGRSLLAFDYDGTLAPIVDDPAQAHPRAGTKRLVTELARLYPCALITGRSLADVERFLPGARFHTVIGSHGAEATYAQHAARSTRDWVEALEGKLPEGVRLEDKRYSLSLHYRGVADAEATRARLVELVRTLPDARVVGGKLVVNAVPAAAPSKGDALAEVWGAVGAEAMLYIGDDESDEEVFAGPAAGTLIGVTVERREGSAAAYFLEDQREVDDLIGALVDLRARR